MTSDEQLPELRVSDADRDRVAEVLREALAEGRLEMNEFEERLEDAYKAKTNAELEPLTRDLPSLSMEKRQAPAPAEGWAGRIGVRPTSSRTAIACMSGFQRRGRWTVPRRFSAYAFCGGGELDLREADFEAAEVEIRCIAVMGGVNVVLPPDVELEVRGLGIMGGFDQAQTGVRGAPGAPRVVLSGFAFWGGVATSRKRRKQQKELED